MLSTAAKVSTHMNNHSNSQFDNKIKKLSDKQKNIKNNLNAISSKEENQISKYKKQQIERNSLMRQLLQKLKEKRQDKLSKI